MIIALVVVVCIVAVVDTTATIGEEAEVEEIRCSRRGVVGVVLEIWKLHQTMEGGLALQYAVVGLGFFVEVLV